MATDVVSETTYKQILPSRENSEWEGYLQQRLRITLDSLGWKRVMNLKRVYLDVDGVLSIPYYLDLSNTKLIPGGTPDWWERYCFIKREDAYSFCKPMPILQVFTEWCDSVGIECMVLTTEQIEYAIEAKKKFVNTYYPKIKEFIVVEKSSDKVEILKKAEYSLGVDRESLALIDDTFEITLQVASEGFTGIPISYFLVDCLR